MGPVGLQLLPCLRPNSYVILVITTDDWWSVHNGHVDCLQIKMCFALSCLLRFPRASNPPHVWCDIVAGSFGIQWKWCAAGSQEGRASADGMSRQETELTRAQITVSSVSSLVAVIVHTVLCSIMFISVCINQCYQSCMIWLSCKQPGINRPAMSCTYITASYPLLKYMLNATS